VLARLAERAVQAIDVDDLSADEALLLYILADRVLGAVWRSHRQMLMTVFRAAVTGDDESDDE
jgi:hypothetical protein